MRYKSVRLASILGVLGNIFLLVINFIYLFYNFVYLLKLCDLFFKIKITLLTNIILNNFIEVKN